MDTAAEVARVHAAPGVFAAAPREALRVTGKDRVRFLQGMLSNDIVRLTPGAGCRAGWLTPKGKVLADVSVACESDALWLLAPAGQGEAVRAGLDRFVIADDVVLEAASGPLVALAGPGTWAALGAAPPAASGLVPATVGRATLRAFDWREAGEEGALLLGAAGPAEVAAALGAPVVGGEAFDVLRIEAGIARFGVDFGPETLLLEAGLGDLVSYTKGCYVGQETVARQHARGHLNRDLRGLRIEGDTAPARGEAVAAGGRPDAGVVTSACRSPRLGVIALASLHRSAWAPGTGVQIGAAGQRATVVALPFGAA